MRRTVVCVMGTRPEGVKMAPVILALSREPWVDLKVVSTGQHREMLRQVLEFFDIEVDCDLALMHADQALAGLSARALTALDELYGTLQPDIVVAQGDTTTVAMAGLAAFYRKVPFAHVEAGLRTFDLQNPFPEELNRVIAGRIADLHFAPTAGAADALRKELTPDDRIFVTGNTVIDALMEAVSRKPAAPFDLPDDRRVVLVTLHRRESFGPSIGAVCDAVRDIVDRVGDVQVVWPVHLNPNVRVPVLKAFADDARVRLCDPLPYSDFVAVMMRAHLILTDSGGVQEEAPALGKPVLVLRDVTERPEAVEQGVVALVGTSRERIVGEACRLLTSDTAYRAMARGTSPYGDGYAAPRIVAALQAYLGVKTEDLKTPMADQPTFLMGNAT